MTISQSSVPSAARFGNLFQDPGARAKATNDLAALGSDALPILKALLSGEAKNEFGVQYRLLAQVEGCSYVTMRLLGPLAISLEPELREGLRSGHVYAFEAAGGLGSLTDETIVLLAESLAGSALVSGKPLVPYSLAAPEVTLRYWKHAKTLGLLRQWTE